MSIISSSDDGSEIHNKNNGRKNSNDNDIHAAPNDSSNERYELDLNGTSSPSSTGFYFLSSPSAVDGLLNYKFHGEDRSYLYQYALSPLATYVVQHYIPLTMAPNTVTLLGLWFMISSYLLLWYYAPTLQIDDNESPPPNWIFFYHACAMFIYQTLDNCDGKQARKTGNCSPLGSLFDHGIDAINSIIGSANWIIAMGLNPTNSQVDLLYCFVIVFGPYTLFYFSTWEEYHIKKLILPPFNGPSEGLLLGMLLTITSALYGPQFWHTTTCYDNTLGLSSLLSSCIPKLRNCDLVILAGIASMLQETGIKSYTLYSTTTTATKTQKNIFQELQPFFLFVLTAFMIGVLDHDLFLRNPRTCLHLYACLFVEMITQLMLSNITNQPFMKAHNNHSTVPQRWIMIPFVLYAVHLLFVQCILLSLLPEEVLSDITYIPDHWLMIYTTAGWTYLLFKMSVVIHEICIILDIYCFDIVTPSRRRNKQKPL